MLCYGTSCINLDDTVIDNGQEIEDIYYNNGATCSLIWEKKKQRQISLNVSYGCACIGDSLNSSVSYQYDEILNRTCEICINPYIYIESELPKYSITNTSKADIYVTPLFYYCGAFCLVAYNGDIVQMFDTPICGNYCLLAEPKFFECRYYVGSKVEIKSGETVTKQFDKIANCWNESGYYFGVDTYAFNCRIGKVELYFQNRKITCSAFFDEYGCLYYGIKNIGNTKCFFGFEIEKLCYNFLTEICCYCCYGEYGLFYWAEEICY